MKRYRLAANPGLSRRKFGLGLAALTASPAIAGGLGHQRLAEAARGLAPNGLRLLTPAGAEANLDVIVSAFQDISGIPVTIETTGIRDVGNDLMLRHLTGNEQWDVALPATNELPDLIAAGAISALPDEELSDSADEAIYRHGDYFDGRRFGYQTDGDQQMLFFNRELLADPDLSASWEDRKGRPMGVPQSWSELDEQMRHVTDPEADRWGGFINRAPGFVEIEFWLRLLAKGVWPLGPDLQPQIASDEGIEALVDMIKVTPAIAPQAPGPVSPLAVAHKFEEGRILCVLSYGGLQKILNRQGGPLAGKLAFSVPPGGGGPNLPAAVPAMTWGWSYTVPTKARHAEAAKLFSAFAVSGRPSTEAIRVASGFFDPFLERHYRDKTIQAVYGREFLDVHHSAMANSIPDFYVSRRGDYMAALARWLGLALDERIEPRVALESVEKDWKLINKSLDRDSQPLRWRALRAAFPDHIARYLRDPARPAPASSVVTEG